MIATDFIAQELKRRNLSLWCFGGGTVVPLFDSCHKAGVETIVCRSEYGAAYAAIGAAKATGKTQVVAVTSGPGAVGLVQGIADAYYDSVPLVCLTGQVAITNSRTSGALLHRTRQVGFQQTPIVDITKPITKMSFGDYIGRNGEGLARDFVEAITIAESGRPGPVLVDMPMDTQRREVSLDLDGYLSETQMSIQFWEKYGDELNHVRDSVRPSRESLATLAGLLTRAERPVFLVGAGCRAAYQQLRTFVERLGIPCVASLPAVDIMPTDSPAYFGMVGHTGLPCANWIVQHSDLVVALGVRLDVRQTGTEVVEWAKNKKIVRVDIDQAELDQSRVRCDLAIHARCEDVLEWLIDRDLPQNTNRLDWFLDCMNAIADMNVPDSQFARVIGEIDEQYDGDVVFVTGVGSHQQHAARHLTLDFPRRSFLTSAGHGCMGAGLPMAIGAGLATGRRIVLIDGDGSFQLSLNELGTLAEYYPRCDLHIHIIDNGSGGIVSQFARLGGYDPRETTWHNPDFKKIAEAYGVSLTVHKIEEEGVWPILESGRRADDMTYPKSGKL